MTIEAKRQESRFFGLRRRTVTSLMDFRAYSEKRGAGITISSSPDTLMLKGQKSLRSGKMPHETDFIFASARSEDELELRRSTGLLDDPEVTVLFRDEINEANLRSEDGEIVVWRQTLAGDYPPLKPGQTARPIQLDFRLT